MQEDTLLHRQVHPSFLKEGRPTRQVFELFLKDKGKLSLYNGEKWTPEDAYLNHTETLGFKSIGSFSVTPREIAQVKDELGLDLLQEIEDNDPFDGHVSVDQLHLTAQVQKDVRTLLLAHAVQRGWTYQQGS